jgi:hypothetical protein
MYVVLAMALLLVYLAPAEQYEARGASSKTGQLLAPPWTPPERASGRFS